MTSVSARRTMTLRVAAGVAAAAALCLGLVGCSPEPSPSASASSSPSATSASATPTPSASVPDAPSSAPSPAPSSIDTAPAGAQISLPTACEQLYSPAMLERLLQYGPLNDPEVTMTSTQNVEALELLSTGIPSIRCTWGVPSETGLATNVSIIDAAQSTTISDSLLNNGFACTPLGDGTICRLVQETLTLDDRVVALTETHILRGNGWVSTYTINFDDAGYSEDIGASLWG